MLRVREKFLCRANRDAERSLTAAAKRRVVWCVDDGPLHSNFLLHLSAECRNAILTPKSGQERVRELLRRVHGVPKPHLALATVASQFDPRARARDAGRALAAEGIHVFSYRKNKQLEKLVAKMGRRTFVLACRALQVRKSDTR